jgi:hypothetical protein
LRERVLTHNLFAAAAGASKFILRGGQQLRRRYSGLAAATEEKCEDAEYRDGCVAPLRKTAKP